MPHDSSCTPEHHGNLYKKTLTAGEAQNKDNKMDTSHRGRIRIGDRGDFKVNADIHLRQAADAAFDKRRSTWSFFDPLTAKVAS
jgi:hypothetical protein